MEKRWPDEVFFLHGSNHSSGFVRKSLDFKVKSSQVDVEGMYLILGATIQDKLLINIYTSNKSAKQSLFFQALSEFISDEEYQETNCKISTGGDFNPFAPGDFVEKRILKLVEWFSVHCCAIKS